MPHDGGPDARQENAFWWPGPKRACLCMSGYTDDSTVRHGLLEARFAFLQKPITPETLARKAREVLDAGLL